jgi:hypothetical protein
MIKKIAPVLMLSTILLLIAGCTTISPTPVVQPPTQAATEVVNTQTPIVQTVIVVVTATPDMASTATAMQPSATQLVLSTATATTAPLVVYPTATPGAFDTKGTPVASSSSITITNVQENSSGKALITWTSSGTFPKGFLIFYSESFANPFYGGYPYYSVTDGTAHSAYIDGTPGKTYSYRICQSTGSGCNFYSNSYSFTFPGATSTP